MLKNKLILKALIENIIIKILTITVNIVPQIINVDSFILFNF